jgi:hypothetical protein
MCLPGRSISEKDESGRKWELVNNHVQSRDNYLAVILEHVGMTVSVQPT